jgi:hypothetical protein
MHVGGATTPAHYDCELYDSGAQSSLQLTDMLDDTSYTNLHDRARARLDAQLDYFDRLATPCADDRRRVSTSVRSVMRTTCV